ncbi:MAG: helix-turn-helix domain-containing protein [Bryobacterales bacterium]|nr:helix-turn-helix domain-containing protein [Bryobacterales bacterium]
MPKPAVENRLAAMRKTRGIGASDLARRVGVSRQTIYAIEAGTFIPNTEVALLLARELEAPIGELFALQASAPAPETLSAELLSASPAGKGQSVRIAQIGSRWMSVPVPVTPFFMPEADGILQEAPVNGRQAALMVFAKEEASHHRLLLAGCDPATSLLANMAERASGIEIISAAASSKLALGWLKEGKVHIAGSHLEDRQSGEFNLPQVRRQFAGEEMLAVTFAHWEEGFVVAPGNPKGIAKAEHLARKNTRFVNRETGSGIRSLADRLLADAGIPAEKVQGYERIAFGHLPAAFQVLSGDADVCLATRSAARTFGLDFIALHSARYDFILRRRSADLPSVKALLDLLQLATLRRKLEYLAGYDTRHTGERRAI